MANQRRLLPNILVTGTPGVGKSSLCSRLQQATGLNWIEISKVAIENDCIEEHDVQYQCPVLDEDKLLDGLENQMSKGGNIVDYHSADLFPERWFDIVFVLRTDNTILYDRLVARGYSGKKLEDNVACEIMEVLLQEAKEGYRQEIVHELHSSSQYQLEDNLKRIFNWINDWIDGNH